MASDLRSKVDYRQGDVRGESIFLRGVKIRTDAIYKDPQTNQEYRLKGVTGSIPSAEVIKQKVMVQRQQTGQVESKDISESERIRLSQAIARGRIRATRERTLLSEAKRLGVRPTVQEVKKAQERELSGPQVVLREAPRPITPGKVVVRYDRYGNAVIVSGNLQSAAQRYFQLRKYRSLEGKIERLPQQDRIVYSLLKKQGRNVRITERGLEWQDRGKWYVYGQGQLLAVKGKGISKLKFNPEAALRMEQKRIQQQYFEDEIRVFTTLKRLGRDPVYTGRGVEWKEGGKLYLYKQGQTVAVQGKGTQRLKTDVGRIARMPQRAAIRLQLRQEKLEAQSLYNKIQAAPKEIIGFARTLRAFIFLPFTNRSNQEKKQQMAKVQKALSKSIASLVMKSSKNKAVIIDLISTYIRNYPNILRNTFLTKEGRYKVLRIAASPFIGTYQSIKQVYKDKKLSELIFYTNMYYRVFKPKTTQEIQLKNYIYDLYEKAARSSREQREKYKQDMVNAMLMQGILLAVIGGEAAAVALTKAGYGSAGAIVHGTTSGTVSLYAKYEYAKAIIYPSPENIGDLIDIGLIQQINRAGLPIRFGKYLNRIPNKTQRTILGNIWKIGKVVGRRFRKIKLTELDYSQNIKNKKLRVAFDKTVRQTRAVLYGSKLEYEAKVKYLQNIYSKLFKKKLTKKETLDLFYKLNKNVPRKILTDLMDPPKDLDFVVQRRFVKDFIKALDRQYRYLPDLLQQYVKSKKWTKRMDLGLKQIRKNRSSVFSALTKVQIDDLLKGLTTNAETTAFKILFLENAYREGISRQALHGFDLEGSGLENAKLNFKLDLHSDNEVAFTKTILGFIRKKEFLPLELPLKRKFTKAIIQLQKTKDILTAKKETYLKGVAKQFAKEFKKIGLTLDQEAFVRIFPRFLEKSEITDVQGFDFLQMPKSAVNKKIMKAYQEAIDFLIMTTPAKLAKRKTISQDVKINILVQKLLKYSRKSARTLTQLDAAISELDERKKILVYYSLGSRKVINEFMRFKKKGFKLKPELSPKEQQLLLNLFSRYDRFIQAKYTDKIIQAEIARTSKTKEMSVYGSTENMFIDLLKTVDRDLQQIKHFKTDKLQITKDGKVSLRVREQVKRRVAGAVSRIFESRRAKDLKKLYNDIKIIELAHRNILSQYKAAPLKKRLFLLSRFKNTALMLKLKIMRFKMLAKKVTKDYQRIESIITTKGVSETVGLKDIDFDSYDSAKGKKILKLLMFKPEDSRLIEYDIKKAYLGKTTKAAVRRKVDNRITKALIKAAERRVIPRKYLKAYFSKIKSLIISYAVSKVSKSISKSKSLSRPSRSISRSGSRSRSRSLSISTSVSGSTSASKSKSRSKSISKSVSKSVSKSKSQSKSKSKSKSRSRSRSKSLYRPLTKIPGIPRLSWTTKLPRGITPIVNILIKRRGRIRELRSRTTPNRAIKRAVAIVDSTLIRSFQLKIVGITRKKDIAKQSLIKFRLRKGKDPRVLLFVEKAKYALDSKGEKAQLRAARRRK